MPASADAVRAYSSEAIALLRDLVSFDTVSRHSNLALIQYIEQYLQGFAVASVRILSKDGSKANLLARIGPEAEGGIILSGHTDVVPIDGQKWDTPPFTLTESMGRLYGRGTADMKSFIACTLAMVPAFAQARLAKPIYLAFSYDEEIGCLGAPDLVAHIARHAKRPALAIVGEPTSMQVVTAHKGVYSYETVVSGVEAHSSQPHLGVNAVHIGAKLVAHLSDLADEQAQSGMQNPAFTPPYSTVHVGVLEGGTARNIIPRTCRLVWEIRPLPGDDVSGIIAKFEDYAQALKRDAQAKHPDADIVTTPMSCMHGMQFSGTEAAQGLVMACAQANETHAVAFGTEAGVFQDGGVPVVVCGPGSIDQAHKPNEYIEVMQLEKCVGFLLRLVEMV